MFTSMNPQPAPLPQDDLHAAVEDHPEGKVALSGLHAEISRDTPDAQAVQRHVGVLQGLPASAGLVERWLDQPATQHWLQVLSNIGL
jgi:hypothetical protein